MATYGLEDLRTSSVGQGLKDNERVMLEAFHGTGSQQRKVRKELRFDAGTSASAESKEVDVEAAQVSVAKLMLEDNKVPSETEVKGASTESLASGEIMVDEGKEDTTDLMLQETNNSVEKDQYVDELETSAFDVEVGDVETLENLEASEFEEQEQSEKIVKEKEAGEKKQRVKKKVFNANSIFVGRTSKKRMVQALISPRKKVSSRNSGRSSKDSGADEVKGTSNPRAGSEKTLSSLD